ncbi:MAG: hypothetical protein ABIP79_00530 [Chitinophagaceae bacterium]
MKIAMTLKIIIFIFFMGGIKSLHSSFPKKTIIEQMNIDKVWWDGLSDEWKTILLINQNFSKQHTDIYAVQNGYVNRMHTKNQDDYSEMNQNLHDLNSKKAFGLTYYQFYDRAIKYKFVTANDSINLATLGELEMIYMVGGPGDLTPLTKFPNLKVLILNSCGTYGVNRIDGASLDLEPLSNLNKLQVLECNAHLLHSIEPIKNLTALRHLRIESSEVTNLSPLKKLVNLEVLTVRTKAKSVSVISKLINLRALHLNGFKKLPNLSNLKKLESLSICEDEIALVNSSYRINNLGFLTALKNLKYLDLNYTSYRGDLMDLIDLQNLKAITLPEVSRYNRSKFKDHHKNCLIINSYEFE